MSFYLPGIKSYRITINGQVLAEPREGALQTGYLENFDLTQVLKAGRNLITLSAESVGPRCSLGAEGIVFCADGTTVRILEDGWKGAWNLASGWERTADPLASLGTLPRDRVIAGRVNSVPIRPYLGPIQIAPVRGGRREREPIFDAEEPVRLELTLVNLKGRRPTLMLEVLAESSRKIVETRKVELQVPAGLDLTGNLNLGPLPRGAYRLRFTLTDDGAELDRRDYEVASVGPIPQRLVPGTSYEDGMDLKEVWSVDCTAEPGPGSFLATNTAMANQKDGWSEVETRVAAGPAGRYRELARNVASHNFAYKYTVKRLFVPHLAVVEYPDDAPRNMLVQIMEPGTHGSSQHAGWQRSDSSVITSQDLFPARSNRMQKLHLLFWPNSETGSIHVVNISGGARPAAAARITIYEVTNDLPALKIADAGDRLIGVHSERGPWTMASTHYAGPLGSGYFLQLGPRDHPEFYQNWYSTTENWIKRMRFSGQNLYLMGHFMYEGTLLPSRLNRYGYNQNNYGGGDWVRDYVSLILRMFERNGMAMISGVEHFTMGSLAANQPTPEQVRAGAEHLFQVCRDGTLFPVHAVRYTDGRWTGSGQPRPDGSVRWPAANYFHPAVQERLLALVGELADQCGGSPAWKGVAFVLSRCMGPMAVAHLRSIELGDAGYEDYTIGLFERETGLKLPVDGRDPDRFEKRCQWLQANARERWLTWRCAKYTALFRQMRDRIARVNPGAKLHLILGEPMLWVGSQEITDGHYDDQAYLLDVLRQFGFDLPELKKQQGIVVSGTYAMAGSGEVEVTKGHEGWRELVQNSAWQALLADDGANGSYIKSGLVHYGDYQYPKDRWLFGNAGTRQAWLYSTLVNETFVNVMARSNPTLMPHTWTDVCESMARLHEQRLFARAYRSLPNGRYERLQGNGLDQNLWVSRVSAGGMDHAYAANLNWWEPTVTLRFAPGSQVRDLIRDEPVTLVDGAWRFRLAPYSIQSFRLDRGTLLGAETTIDQPDRKHIETAVRASLQAAEEVLAQAVRREAEFAGQTGWDALPELRGRTARLNAAWRQGDLATAFQLTTGALPMAREKIARILRGEKIIRAYR